MINNIKLVFLCFYLLFRPLFRVFFEARAEIQKYIPSFLVRMKTLKICFRDLLTFENFRIQEFHALHLKNNNKLVVPNQVYLAPIVLFPIFRLVHVVRNFRPWDVMTKVCHLFMFHFQF